MRQRYQFICLKKTSNMHISIGLYLATYYSQYFLTIIYHNPIIEHNNSYNSQKVNFKTIKEINQEK